MYPLPCNVWCGHNLICDDLRLSNIPVYIFIEGSTQLQFVTKQEPGQLQKQAGGSERWFETRAEDRAPNVSSRLNHSLLKK